MTKDSLEGINVLVAEDNLINQKVITAILKRYGATYQIAQNGEEAVNMYNNEFHIILMDCQMPVFDGYQATSSIRVLEQNQDQKRRPIIALTANAMLGDREKCIAVGMDDFLSKPFKSSDLVEIIHKWVLPRSPTEDR